MVFVRGGDYVKTINNPVNQATWTEQLNLGQGMAEIMTSDEYNETSIGIGDYIEYRVRGDIVYSGFVVNIDRYIDVRDTNIKYYVRGLGTVLGDVLVDSWNTPVLDPSEIVEEAIDDINDAYEFFTKDIKPFGATEDFILTGESALKRINLIREQSILRGLFYDYFVYPDGRFKFSNDWDTVHSLTIGREIEEMEIQERGESIINKLVLTRGFPDNASTSVYEDITSQEKHGLRTVLDTSQELRIQNQGRADSYGNGQIAQNKDPKITVRMVVNESADLLAIHPGDSVNVMGLDYDLPNIRVERLQFVGEKVVLYFEVLESFISLIKQ